MYVQVYMYILCMYTVNMYGIRNVCNYSAAKVTKNSGIVHVCLQGISMYMYM